MKYLVVNILNSEEAELKLVDALKSTKPHTTNAVCVHFYPYFIFHMTQEQI